MCDQDTLDDLHEYELRQGALSRRSFNALALGAGFLSALPAVADALKTTEGMVEIKTPDGTADGYFVHPTDGAHPGVLIWPDIYGLRPAFKEMGKRLAESGYAVLVVNPFYRSGPATATAADPASGMPQSRGQMRQLINGMVDGKAFIAWLDSQKAVDKKRKLATTGYCMGGPLVFQTVGGTPERLGAGATFHAGGLVGEGADSPHRLIPRMKAQFLIAIAANDDARRPEEKNVLKEAFAQAKLPAEIEVYADTQHGWCPPDSRAYNAPQAEKAWERMLALFKKAL